MIFGVSISAIVATIPAVIAGYMLNANDALVEMIRNVEVIAWTTLIFGIILGVSDRASGKRRFVTTNILGMPFPLGLHKYWHLFRGQAARALP